MADRSPFRWGLAGVVALAFALGALPASGQQAPTPADETEVTLGMYTWGIALTGRIDADHASAKINASFDDVLSALNVAVMGAASLRKGRFVAQVDGLWTELEDDVRTRAIRFGPLTLGPGDLDARTQLGMLDLKLGYRVVEARPDLPLDVDLLIGARYLYQAVDIDFTLPPLLRVDADGSTDWVDPLAGARVSWALSPELTLSAQGDFGIWSLGTASESTWQAMGLVRWRFADTWSAVAGWRALEFKRGVTELQLHGPVLAALYHF